MDVDLRLGDCLDVLPTLAAGSVHAVVTDPPFEEEAHTLQRRKLGRSTGNGREIVEAPLPFAAIDSATRIAFSREAVRVCRGWILVFCQAEAVADWRDCLIDAGASYKRSMVWVKPDGMPQYSGDRPGMGYESIVAAWAGTGGSHWNGGGSHGVFTHNKSNGAGPNIHPTQKPLQLMARLIGLFTNEGETVLDAFMGSGTTGVACVKAGRHFLGIEVSPDYHAIAQRRIADAQAQLTLPLFTQEKSL